MPEPEAEGRVTARVAVVVVPGVGDEEAGAAARQVGQGLARHVPGYRWLDDPPALPVGVPAEGRRPAERYDAPRRSIARDDEPGTTVDLVEMSWADLSSFPRSGLLPFFASLFGLGLQLATAGLEARRPRPGPVGGPPVRQPGNRAMEAVSWWTAAVIVPVTLVAALIGTALWLAVDDSLGVPDLLAVLAVAVVGYMALRVLSTGIADGGWGDARRGVRRLTDPRVVAMALFAAAVGMTAQRITVTGSIEGGLGQATLVAGGYAVRPAWMVGLTLVAVALVALARRPTGVRTGPRLEFTSVATTILSPLTIAIVGTVLVGGIGAVAFAATRDSHWRDPGTVRCLSDPADWTWGADCARGAASPTDWATEVFENAMLPLVPIVIVALAVLVLAAMVVVADRRPGEGPGARLTGALSIFTGPAGTRGLWALGLVSIAAALATWAPGDPLDLSSGGGIQDPGQPWAWASVSALGALALSRVVPLDPRRWRGDIGGPLAKVRRVADIPYDVATYLRIDRDSDGVRSRVVARYRALLDEVGRRYTHVVVVAHSQGSMYSLATLFGDEERREPEAGRWGVLPWRERRPGSPLERMPVSLLTFGCPITQTYAARLPGQYAWPREGDAAALAERTGLVSVAWINAYRPRDYVGRAVFHDPSDPARGEPGRGVRAAAGDAVLADVCLHGAGGHTGYFGTRDLTLWLDGLIRATLGRAAATPPGYEITPPLPTRAR